MSTRVQKGGAVFKPVAKARARAQGTVSRNASTAPVEDRDIAAPSVPVVTATGNTLTSIAFQPAQTPLSSASSAVPAPRIDSISPNNVPIVTPTFVSSQYTQPPMLNATPTQPTTTLLPSVQATPQTRITAPAEQSSEPSSTILHHHPPVQQAVREAIQIIHSAGSSSGPAPPEAAFVSWPNPPFSEGPRSTVPVQRLALASEHTVKLPQKRSTRSVASTSRAAIPDGPMHSDGGGQSVPKRKSRKNLQHDAFAGPPNNNGIGPSQRRVRQKTSEPRAAPDADTEQSGQRTSTNDEARKTRRRRTPSVPAFDTSTDPGADLDETAVTMGQLCKDTGQGRVSSRAALIRSNHAAWKAANKEKRVRMRSVSEMKKYGKNPEDEENDAGTGTDTNARPSVASATATATNGSTVTEPQNVASGSDVTLDARPTRRDATSHGFDYSLTMSTSRFNVQVRIGPNGETIVDEESLFVDRNMEENSAEYTHVEESDTTKFINSATYGKKFRGSRWSAEETDLFYDALSQFGENYELISYVLPGRDRTACKNKFKAEDRKNPARIDFCLNNRIPYDIQTLSRMTGKDFSGPTPEIRAPVLLTLKEVSTESPAPAAEMREEVQTPRAETHVDGEEVLGDIDDFKD